MKNLKKIAAIIALVFSPGLAFAQGGVSASLSYAAFDYDISGTKYTGDGSHINLKGSVSRIAYDISLSDGKFDDRVFSKNDSAITYFLSPNIGIDLIGSKIKLATVKSKYSLVSSSAELGEGTITMHNSIINSSANIGMNCILNTNCIIEHDVKIGNHCHISTGVIINGGVTIGSESFLGSGCIIREGVNIGHNVLVSAGKVVMNDIASNTIYK